MLALMNGITKEILIEKDTLFSIGRKHDNELVLWGANVSRYHARCWYSEEEKSWVIQDLNSLNGTKVNGVSVMDGTQIKSGDSVEIGCHKMFVTVNSPSLLTGGA